MHSYEIDRIVFLGSLSAPRADLPTYVDSHRAILHFQKPATDISAQSIGWLDNQLLADMIRDSSRILTALHTAASIGDTGIVKRLIGVDVHSVSMGSASPIHFAVLGGHEAIVHLLLDTGKVDLTLKMLGQTLLQLAQ